MTHTLAVGCLPSLLEAMRVSLVQYATKFVDWETAEDIVQESFVRLIELNRPDLHEMPHAYFKAVVRNVAMDTLNRRSRDRQASNEMQDELCRGGDRETPMLDDDIRTLLAELSHRQWESLVMTVVFGMTEREAASAAYVSRSAVTGSRERALASLRGMSKRTIEFSKVPNLSNHSDLPEPVRSETKPAKSFRRLAG